MKPWQTHIEDDQTILTSEALTIAFQENVPRQFHWKKDDTRLELQGPHLQLLRGDRYDRWSLNRLTENLALVNDSAPELRTDGSTLEWSVVKRVDDLEIQEKLTAHGATGEVILTRRVTKKGPGRSRLQWVTGFSHDIGDEQPLFYLWVPTFSHPELLWDLAPIQASIMEQEKHSIRRARLLGEPRMHLVVPSGKALLHWSSPDGPVVVHMETTRKSRRAAIQWVPSDFTLNSGDSKTTSLHLKPGLPTPEQLSAPPPADPSPQTRKELLKQVDRIEERLTVKPAHVDPAWKLREDVARWKLKLLKNVLPTCEYDHAEGLLADAEAALNARDAELPAELPTCGELLMENSFREHAQGWQGFGFAEVTFDHDKGMHLAPEKTVNLWTEQEFSGDLWISFDYCPTSEHYLGGTFLQVSGKCINPRDETDFMASATGYMPYYNFGISCYHLSFNRGNAGRRKENVASVCNFRKTGNSFYLLAQVAEPAGQENQWIHVDFCRRDNQFLFFVDGQLVLEYIDHGHQGVILREGRIGLRNWGEQHSWFRDFKVRRPTAE